MFDYNIASLRYARGKCHPTVGVKIINNVYMTRPKGCKYFVLSEVFSRYTMVQSDGYSRYVLSEKSKWRMMSFAEIHPDKILLQRKVSNRILSHLFNLTSFASKTKSVLGREWEINGTTYNGETPLEIRGHELVFLDSRKYLKTDKEKNAAFLERMRRVRKAFVIRAKLGAFDNFYMHHEHLSEMRACKKHVEMLGPYIARVTEDDIRSFSPLLSFIIADKLITQFRPVRSNPFTSDELIKMFDSVMRKYKHDLKLYLGVTEYVDEWQEP